MKAGEILASKGTAENQPVTGVAGVSLGGVKIKDYSYVSLISGRTNIFANLTKMMPELVQADHGPAATSSV